MPFHDILALAVGSIGLAIIIWGVLVEAVRFIMAEYTNLRKRKTLHFLVIRHELGMYLLLGLEFLIAGEMVHTLFQPSLDQVFILALVVAIRTVLSFFLTREMERGVK